MRKNTFGDCLIAGGIAVIGMAEAWHLAAVFLKLAFTDCARLIAVSLSILLVLGTGFLIARRKRIFAKDGRKTSAGVLGQLFYAAFVLMAVSQLIFIGIGNATYRSGDMMVETVESFLVSDGIYQVNPMTGMPYAEGMPLRLKILCLPTLYGSLCRWTGLRPALVIRTLVPMAVLLSCYVSFSVLGRTLFPEDRQKRACFLLLTSLLLWVGAYGYGMDGFNLLCCGWQGVAIRSGVLLPWTLSLCLRHKWFGAFLCVLAEGSIVWTFYGCGICLAVTAGMAVAELLCGRQKAVGKGEEAK